MSNTTHKKRKEDYIPKNDLSKLYYKYIGLEWQTHGYEAGGYCRGHKSRTKDNQMLSQRLRTCLKRETQQIIENELDA